jgi:hypothetical protein
MEKIDRTGEEGCNNFGTPMKIVEYKDAMSIIVEFQDEYKTRVSCNYGNFKKGKVKNPYDKTVYGVGYIGKGKYKVSRKDGKQTNAYMTWQSMIRRCYDPYFLNKNSTYIDCYVCEEWHDFQNFAEWYYKNYYEIENDKMCLDKDILCKNNKIYSSETCVFVPHRINILFVKHGNARGEYPIGISYNKKKKRLHVQCHIYRKGETKYLGSFPLNRPFQAFYIYKTFKEKYIKQIAEEYKGMIPIKLYNAMYAYEVEIND